MTTNSATRRSKHSRSSTQETVDSQRHRSIGIESDDDVEDADIHFRWSLVNPPALLDMSLTVQALRRTKWHRVGNSRALGVTKWEAVRGSRNWQ